MHDGIKELNTGEWKAKLQLSKTCVKSQQNTFWWCTVEATTILNASRCIYHIIALKILLFVDGEVIQECISAAGEEIAPISEIFQLNQFLISNCVKMNSCYMKQYLWNAINNFKILCQFFTCFWLNNRQCGYIPTCHIYHTSTRLNESESILWCCELEKYNYRYKH